MNRRDWHTGRLHVIRRNYGRPPLYGWMWWNGTLDVWVRQTLWTFRTYRRYE